jgi:outer membrane biosynthesis protein TonB
VHGALALGLLAIPHVSESPPRDEPGIDLVEVGVAKLDSPPDQDTGGGTPTTRATELPKPTATRDHTVPHRSTPDGDHSMRVADLIGSQTVEARGDGGTGTGSGGGIGDGIGDGICGCALDGIPPPPPAPPPPPPPEAPQIASKARKPKLIFPARERESDPDRLFVAMVTIDEDGYVVGAKLVRGRGGAADRRAEELIWRFRYEPARDADGRAIRTQLEQQFLVQ